MKQFLLPQDWPQNPILTGDDFHYLVHVRRLDTGRKLQCRTRSGESVVAVVESIAETHITLRPISESAQTAKIGNGTSHVSEKTKSKPNRPGQGSARLHLLQGIPKGKKLDLIIRQATELGVSTITPINCKHSIPELDGNWAVKSKRYEAVIREAYQQSGGAELPSLNPPLDIDEGLASLLRGNGAVGFFLHEKELEQSTAHGYLRAVPHDIYLLVGPEGGFAPEETDRLVAFGFKPWFLGEQVLRCETAAIVGLGALRVLLQERLFWNPTDRNTL